MQEREREREGGRERGSSHVMTVLRLSTALCRVLQSGWCSSVCLRRSGGEQGRERKERDRVRWRGGRKK